MATGFTALARTFGAASVAALLAFASLQAHSADVVVTALFNGKAMLSIDNGKARMLSVGQSTPEGVKLISATSESAVIEIEGKRQTLVLGQGTHGNAAAGTGSGQVTLLADSRGHFFADGSINGSSARFLVDTGASRIALSTLEAKRLGVSYLSAPRGLAQTANGAAVAYTVKLDTVRIGDITVNNVDAAVIDGAGLNVILLGMSFLNRMQMRRDGETLVLVKRF
jgi:aspartyl protease family protein